MGQNLFPTGLPTLVSISKPGGPCTFPSYPRVLLEQRKSYFPRKGIYLNNFPYPGRKSHFAREIFIFVAINGTLRGEVGRVYLSKFLILGVARVFLRL